MTSREFTYRLPALEDFEFPQIPLPKGARIACVGNGRGEVQIAGNRAGLAYLARKLAAMSMIGGSVGLHVHLDPDRGDVDDGSDMVTIGNTEF